MDWKNKDEIKKYMKQYREKHKDKSKLYQKQYRELHKEEMRRYKKEYYANEKNKNIKRKNDKQYRLEHKEEIKKQQREYYLKNKEELNTRMKKYRKDNVDKLKRYFKEYEKKNRKKVTKRHGKYSKNRRENDLSFRLKGSLASRLRIAVKGITKSDTTMNLVGCSREYLLNYLESQFDDEMSWSDYGRTGWHIDHIKPCKSFDLSKEEEQRKCFHYSNLRPLWAKYNLSRRFEDKVKEAT